MTVPLPMETSEKHLLTATDAKEKPEQEGKILRVLGVLCGSSELIRAYLCSSPSEIIR
jgi:hypothetical protein